MAFMKSNHKTQRINGPRRYPNCSTSKTKPTRIIAQSLLVLILCMLSNIATGLDSLPNGNGCCLDPRDIQCTSGDTSLGGIIKDYLAGGSLKEHVLKRYGNIEDWDVSEVTSMDNVFYKVKGFNSDISKWSVNRVTSMSCMFPGIAP